ncbi:MAG TPA: phosphocholine cytidylyltransferase family protein [Vicinamibacterales bacterium]|nr:phosphocholine cytidylyltransferase family protein [Vicinamibacterales bacterium]
MFPTHAVILAAGTSTRMGSLTADRPKAMLEVGGRSLIDRALEALAACGVHDVTVVAGYRQQMLRDHLGDRVRFIENARYRVTNSLYSLWLAREVLREGAVVMNGDVLTSPELMLQLIGAPVEDAVLIDPASPIDDEAMKVKTWQGFALDFGKNLARCDTDGENVGVLKFGPSGGRRLAGHLNTLIAAGQANAWAPLAFRAFAQEWPLRAVTTDGLPWTEIDFAVDLEHARAIVAPAMIPARRREAV